MSWKGTQINVSSYAEAYTSSFGSFISRVLLEECQLREPPVACCLQNGDEWDTFAAGDKHPSPDVAPEDSPDHKRRKHGIKGPPRDADMGLRNVQNESWYGRAQTWDQVVKSLSPSIPRVGN